MANLTRCSKSPSDWTRNELLAYHITVKDKTPRRFFRVPDPPLDGIDPSLIDSAIDADNVSDSTYQYLTHLEPLSVIKKTCLTISLGRLSAYSATLNEA
jgi:hypothetical protein